MFAVRKNFIWHFCSDFLGVKLHQISNFPGFCPGSQLRELTGHENAFWGSWKTLELALCKSLKVLDNSVLMSVLTLWSGKHIAMHSVT